jgi:hypothetical protein
MSNRPTAPPDPKPARLLRLHLVQAREAGLGFDAAWEQAIKAATADKWWRAAFAWSRDEWESCYERRPATPTAHIFTQLSLPDVGAGYSARPPDDLSAA